MTAYVEPVARWRSWEAPATLVPQAYVAAVSAAGGRPVVLPPLADAAEETLAVMEGLLLTGGADLDPSLYQAPRDPRTTGMSPERDSGEPPLARRALATGLPLLGVCRGMQLLAVVCGGTLHQHLPDVVGHDGHGPAPASYAPHPVRLDRGSRLGGILDESVTVQSHHHQGVATLSEPLRAVGWADDGSIEAVEAPGPAFAAGVLWHPEVGDDPRLFTALVAAARDYHCAGSR
ncbi:MAG: gamma-glutamyl-gamma-aminobutyrate hydrolase family protein [Euzebyaceae bacterium]|nr:gamma-glutamyl-gamma-aminobutyrate hydrolase family protein [Euzebyaceae bacterium]